MSKPILTVSMLNEAIIQFTGILDHWVDNESTHYQREYIYALRALTKEIKQQLEGEFCSLEYIMEKTQVLLNCATEIATNDLDLYSKR